MDFKKIFQKAWPDALAVLFFVLVSTVYFLKPMSEGLVLGGHDSLASIGLGQEQREYRAAHDGETSRWSNAVFSGMPTFQTSPSYSSSDFLEKVQNIYGLGLHYWFPAISFVFLYFLGFYIMLRSMSTEERRISPLTAALGALMWGFSSYFLIIISAGHLWKALTLAFIPPTIGGVVLCMRGKYWSGAAVTALFTAFQVLSNHVQMTYYFLFVIGFLVLCYGIYALVRRTLPAFFKGAAVALVAGLLGVAANLPNLYHTYTYAKESMRGKSELTITPRGAQKEKATDGLDRSYITAWSYGIDETLTLLVPGYKGGGSTSIIDVPGVETMPGFQELYESAGQTQQIFQQEQIQAYPPGIMLYWGDQPMTVGPVYAGAIVCFLFILGLFYVRGPIKWALLLSTMLALLFAWGHNSPLVTDFFIDHLPMYSKFRTVSSALVVVEFAMPALAILCLLEIFRNPSLADFTSWKNAPIEKKIGLPAALISTLGLCLVLWIWPSMAGSCLSENDAEMFAQMSAGGFPADFVQGYSDAVTRLHHALLSASALRSALFIIAAVVALWLFSRKVLKGWTAVGILMVLCLADLWTEDKKYLNEQSFADPVQQLDGYAKTPADEEILKDKGHYRVANLGAGNPFNETSNATSYYHKSIGGYHAAKLHRYQDLIDFHLNRELAAFAGAINEAQGDMQQVNGDSIAPMLNMLNTKYFIFGSGNSAIPILNPYANGNGWFVEKLSFVKNADAEIQALGKLDTKRAAVADERFKPELDGTALGSGTVRLTAYAPNQLTYEVESEKGGVAVFSEIYYPGWTVAIDGKEAEFGRVNYVLRALKVPAGKHVVTAEFRPRSITVTTGIAYGAIVLIFLLLGFVVYKKTA